MSEQNNKKKQLKEKNLTQQMFDTGMIPNLGAGAITILYIVLSANIPKGKALPISLLGIGISLFLQFIIAPITNSLLTRQLSEEMEDFEKYPTTERERTKLLKKLMEFPRKIGLQVFLVFGFGACLWIWSFHFMFNLENYTILSSVCAVALGDFTGFVLSVIESQKVCSKFASKIVAAGIEKDEIDKNHTFGLPSIFFVSIHILIPIIIINVISVLMAWQTSNSLTFEKSNLERIGFIIRTILIVIINCFFAILLSSMLFKRMITSINLMKDLLESINLETINDIGDVPTDLSNEFMYNIYLINSIVNTLKNILKSSENISLHVIESSNELSVISKETSVTSLEQTAGIKELLAAMEDSGALAKSVSEKTNEVSLIASKTNVDISEGFEILRENLNKLAEIKTATESTCDEIRSLGDKISGISDIAGIINSIADQTNIIAFNAELEASGAGEAGKNFYLVANEIRRLTNNTIDSTKEIRNRIIEIQHSSKLLTETSKNAIQKISEGNDIATRLNSNFDKLKDSSQAAESSSDEIKQIINQQAISFEQIVVTLRQIAASAENFSNSTQVISQSSESLCEVAEKLKSINVDGDDNSESVHESASKVHEHIMNSSIINNNNDNNIEDNKLKDSEIKINSTEAKEGGINYEK